jgi:hypothetical protein
MRHPIASSSTLLLAAGLFALPAVAQQTGATDQGQQPAGEQAGGELPPRGGQASAQPGQADTGPAQQQGQDDARGEQRFNGVVLKVEPVQTEQDRTPRLFGQVLLDDGRMTLMDFGTLEDMGQRRAPVHDGAWITATGSMRERDGGTVLVVSSYEVEQQPAYRPGGRPMAPGMASQGRPQDRGQGSQMGPGQMGPGMMGPGRMGPGMMGPGPVGPGQMGPGQMRPGQMGPGMDRGQIQARQGGPGGMGAGGMAGSQSQAGGPQHSPGAFDMLLTGTILDTGTGATRQGSAAAQTAATAQAGQQASQQTAGPDSGTRRITVAGPSGREITADLGQSKVAQELSLAKGDYVVLYGEPGMEQDKPVLMTHFAAKLVALPRHAEAAMPGGAPGARAPAGGGSSAQDGQAPDRPAAQPGGQAPPQSGPGGSAGGAQQSGGM